MSFSTEKKLPSINGKEISGKEVGANQVMKYVSQARTLRKANIFVGGFHCELLVPSKLLGLYIMQIIEFGSF